MGSITLFNQFTSPVLYQPERIYNIGIIHSLGIITELIQFIKIQTESMYLLVSPVHMVCGERDICVIFKIKAGCYRDFDSFSCSLCSFPLQTRRGSLEKFVGDESNKFLRSNTVHLLALTVDCIIALNGGLKHLLAKSTRSGLAESPKVLTKQVYFCREIVMVSLLLNALC